eukprot:CAMPEP_0194101578 /NCGR_PEP_ID=MMETSP0150-20130528/2269_1 /TAXON_ID=122233 /ORGANISM="Chaetoceros debilis, Strain MM31A-1" /LENGTH=154 /DNA_ID=CAMNT_0038788237 /DNA_START=82 /DNA_END=543 /DNA_ORIENTATION=-
MNQRRFDFFSSWDPAALGARDSQWVVPIQHAIGSHEPDKNDKEKRFEMVLKAGMKYYPERLGFLFCKEEGMTSDNHPILHHAIRYAPDLEDDIDQYYPDATFLRDTTGHILPQVEFYMNLRRGKRAFQHNSSFFIRATYCLTSNTNRTSRTLIV